MTSRRTVWLGWPPYVSIVPILRLAEAVLIEEFAGGSCRIYTAETDLRPTALLRPAEILYAIRIVFLFPMPGFGGLRGTKRIQVCRCSKRR